MSSNSSSHNSKSPKLRRNEIRCHCNLIAPRRTAWTKRNIGRRFVGCARYPDFSACGFFDWVDSYICDRGKELLWEMKQKLDDYENEITEFRAREAEINYEIKHLREKKTKDESLQMRNKEELTALKQEIENYKQRLFGLQKILFFLVLLFLIVVWVLLTDFGVKHVGVTLSLP